MIEEGVTVGGWREVAAWVMEAEAVAWEWEVMAWVEAAVVGRWVGRAADT